MYRIYDIHTNETISTFGCSLSLGLDEAINLIGEIHSASEDENVEINGNWYYYDDLAVERIAC